MNVTLAVYNVKWMKDLFHSDGTPKKNDGECPEDERAAQRSHHLAQVIAKVDADILCIVEGPDTLVDGSKTASDQLEKWCRAYELCDDYRAIHGYPSPGQQELCALYKRSTIACQHYPEGDDKKNPFNRPFLVDTTDDLIREQYQHYRPPFEISVKTAKSRKRTHANHCGACEVEGDFPESRSCAI